MTAAQKPVRVKVLHPFSVSHEGVSYWPGETADVPEHIAAQWIRNEWVADEPSK